MSRFLLSHRQVFGADVPVPAAQQCGAALVAADELGAGLSSAAGTAGPKPSSPAANHQGMLLYRLRNSVTSGYVSPSGGSPDGRSKV